MIKPIVTDTHQLQQPSRLASRADLPLATDLKDTLTAHRDACVGMAANMIGVHKRVIIAQLGPLPVVMFNPTLTSKAQPYPVKEGCLSLTGQRPTTRYKRITVDFFNEHWQRQQLTLTDFAAEIVQHELDHCQGILI
ncbi:peptide deformylase [Limosilactobacillus pontis]|uniref:Peptide deformylase n=1 Tax=Limosilactobacillus pontis DSM 8475 TaxID=1423794 RepID=A0A922TNN1_9LACO|nr:peptide deformylase [Limosilactobacillus pontis]KRM37096.1 peptide deformylase [Limosilactobacillus pontis DSM 8475]QFV01236.1 peptide deformylase [Limosilactobacillus pontis]